MNTCCCCCSVAQSCRSAAAAAAISLVSQENVDAGLHEDPKSSHYSLAFHACPTGGSVTCQEAATPTEGRLQPLPAGPCFPLQV